MSKNEFDFSKWLADCLQSSDESSESSDDDSESSDDKSHNETTKSVCLDEQVAVEEITIDGEKYIGSKKALEALKHALGQDDVCDESADDVVYFVFVAPGSSYPLGKILQIHRKDETSNRSCGYEADDDCDYDTEPEPDPPDPFIAKSKFPALDRILRRPNLSRNKLYENAWVEHSDGEEIYERYCKNLIHAIQTTSKASQFDIWEQIAYVKQKAAVWANTPDYATFLSEYYALEKDQEKPF
ncbi:MAG: hypothetical protein ACR2ON_03335 [Paracoccaceae bacterium]